MNYSKEDIIAYRINRAWETYQDAKSLAEVKSWNSCINRLYYACYYAAIALLFENGINAHTPVGVKSNVGQHFVKSQILLLSEGKLYSDLFNFRHRGDYEDFIVYDDSIVQPFVEPVEQFIQHIEDLIRKK